MARVLALVVAATVGSGGCNGNDTTAPACTFAISPAALSQSSAGGTGTITVTTGASCAWTATAGGAWITITGGSSGTGNGTVVYAVAANAATDARTGTISVAGQTHTVTQEGRQPVVCTYEISPATATFTKDSDTATFSVAAPETCAWTATSTSSWLTVSAGGQGSGNGTVQYTVARNTDTVSRSGAIAVADRSFVVNQAGDLGACEYSVAPVDFNRCMPAGILTTALTTQAACPWTVSTDSPWLTLPGGGSGSGSATITVAYTENYDAPRNGVVMVRWPTITAGQNVRLAQAGCLYAVNPSTFSFAAAGGSGTFDVFQQSDPNTCGGPLQNACVWGATADVSWITITTSMPRAGDERVNFAVAPNPATSARIGRMTVRDKVVTVTQAGS